MPQSLFDAVIRQSIAESIAVKSALLADADYLEALCAAAAAMSQAIRQGSKILFFGNGGSAADAQHLAAELVGRYRQEGPALAAIALTTNTSVLSAIANDYAYEIIFARQVEALGNRGDVAVGLTTSGNSANVLKAIETASAKGLITIGLTGATGGKLRALVTHCLCVPCSDTPRIQECHILTGHILCEIVESQCRLCEPSFLTATA
ncbi:MAG TPA: D-sedoheptulose 7-phosphate isomerase [Terriglobales bacterium]|nr:D-sedoheptulose 7-phosphate isomerase [Terriglobales bacterium]